MALTNLLPEPHILVSGTGEIRASNSAAARLFDFDEDGSLKLGQLVCDPPERVADFLKLASRSGSMIPGAFTMRLAGGGTERFGCAGGVVSPANGRGSSVVLVRFRPHVETVPAFLLLNERIETLTRALDERRRTQIELEAYSARLEELAADLEGQKNAAQAASQAKSNFLAAMSHELRTPLNGILGYADLLAIGVKGPVNEGQRSQLQRIRRSTDHLIEIIDQILEYSRQEADAEEFGLEEVELVEVAREAAEMIEPAFIQAGLKLKREDPASGLTVRTDRVRVRQILLNLLSNAVKFTEKGCVRMVIQEGEDRVAISIVDTGIGIEPGDIQRVFEPFWQADRGRGGTGLGLAITLGLARGLGGDIDVESVHGEGSTFTFLLPGAVR